MDMRIEREHIETKGYDYWQSTMGEAVMWHEFDAANTTFDPVYNEGNRHYKPGVLLPMLWVIHTEDSETNEEDGRRVVPSLRCACPISTLRAVGISSPMDSGRHLNDILVYRNTFFGVGDFKISGRLAGSVIVGINANKIFPDEDMIFDVIPELATPQQTRRSLGLEGDTYQSQDFPHHELPA